MRTIPWETKVAWLAGIIDGEGTIGCYFYREKNNYHAPRYGIWVVNADKRIIEEVAQLFKKIGAENVFIGEKNYKKGFGKNQCWYVQVNRKKDIQKILQTIIPYLLSKKEQAEIILDFFEKYPILKRGQKGTNNALYEEMILKIKMAKKRFLVPVTTKR